MAHAALFAGGLDFESKSVDAAGNFFGEKAIDGAVALDLALANEHARNDPHPEVRFSAMARPAAMAGVTGMLMRLVDHL